MNCAASGLRHSSSSTNTIHSCAHCAKANVRVSSTVGDDGTVMTRSACSAAMAGVSSVDDLSTTITSSAKRSARKQVPITAARLNEITKALTFSREAFIDDHRSRIIHRRRAEHALVFMNGR